MTGIGRLRLIGTDASDRVDALQFQGWRGHDCCFCCCDVNEDDGVGIVLLEWSDAAERNNEIATTPVRALCGGEEGSDMGSGRDDRAGGEGGETRRQGKLPTFPDTTLRSQRRWSLA